MGDQAVPDAVVAERFERLRAVVERSALHKHEARVGRVERCLVEGASKRLPGVLAGRTGQNKLVHFAPPASGGAPAAGSYADVRVTGAAPHHLRGELVAVVATARHRMRIPLAVHAG